MKRILIIFVISVLFLSFAFCDPQLPKEDYRLLKMKVEDLEENPVTYDETTYTYAETAHLFWDSSERKDEADATVSTEVQTLNANGFPTQRVRTTYDTGTGQPNTNKEFIDMVFDEQKFLPTSVSIFYGTDSEHPKEGDITYVYNDNSKLESYTYINYDSTGALKDYEYVVDVLKPDTLKKLNMEFLIQGGVVGMMEFLMGIFVPRSMIYYLDDGETVQRESVTEYDNNGNPVSIIETKYYETDGTLVDPAEITNEMYFRITESGGKIQTVEIFSDSALTNPFTETSKVEYTYDSNNIVKTMSLYVYGDPSATKASMHVMLGRLELVWIGTESLSRWGYQIGVKTFNLDIVEWTAAYIANPEDADFEDYLDPETNMSFSWPSETQMIIERQEDDEQRALVDTERTTIDFEIVPVPSF